MLSYSNSTCEEVLNQILVRAYFICERTLVKGYGILIMIVKVFMILLIMKTLNILQHCSIT